MPAPDLRAFVETYLVEHAADKSARSVVTQPSAVRRDADALLPPDELDRPWLVLVDADGWLVDGEAKKEERGENLVREDLELLRPVLAAHVRSGQPGAFAAFVHGADPAHAKGFRTHSLRLADRLGLERVVLGLEASGGARDLAVVMTSVADLTANMAEAWHAAAAER